jgi:hypothetical protein
VQCPFGLLAPSSLYLPAKNTRTGHRLLAGAVLHRWVLHAMPHPINIIILPLPPLCRSAWSPPTPRRHTRSSAHTPRPASSPCTSTRLMHPPSTPPQSSSPCHQPGSTRCPGAGLVLIESGLGSQVRCGSAAARWYEDSLVCAVVLMSSLWFVSSILNPQSSGVVSALWLGHITTST